VVWLPSRVTPSYWEALRCIEDCTPPRARPRARPLRLLPRPLVGWLAGGFGVLEDNIVIDIDLRVGLHRAIARRAVFGNLNAQLAREIVRRMITYPWAQ